MATNMIARTMHEVGLAAWFGGSLMGAVGLNGATGAIDEPHQRARVADSGWSRWTPVNLAAIVAHVAGASVLTAANKGRIAGQRGVAADAAAKAVLTLAALGATAYARALGRKVTGESPVQDATTPTSGTPGEVAQAQRTLTALQWAVPALTGAMLVLDARLGEQQRPSEVSRGILARLFG